MAPCIDGDFQGEISGQGTLVVGEGAVVKANINVQNVYINGDVQGNIDAKIKFISTPPANFRVIFARRPLLWKKALSWWSIKYEQFGKKNTNDSLYG